MLELSTGDKLQHNVYGQIEVTGFITISDEIEINEVEKNGSEELDIVSSVQSENVEFLDESGRELREPLDTFFEHTNIQ
jgi:hypothetical protein